MQQDDKAWAQAEDRGRAADLRAGVCAAVCAFVAIGLLSVNAGFMYSRQDKRIILTTLDVFHDWAGLQGVFRKATSYDPRFNPPSLDYFGKFDGGSVNLDVLQDLLTRGLVSEQRFANYSALFNRTTGEPLLGMADPRDLMELSSAFFSKFLGTVFFNVAPVALSQPVVAASPHFMDPRLLVRLQRISRCSFPDAVAGTTPVTRSPGCACIADTYLRFVRATANMTGNVTAAARGEAADRVVRCMDKRVTLRSWGAGSVWTIHPVALAFYSSGVFFLVCTAYLLSYYHYELFPADWSGDMRVRVIQGILVGLTGVLVLILVLHAPLANGLQAVGLVLSLSTFVFSARGVLNHPSEEQGQRVPFKPEPHPLTVCFWLNLPLLIPGPLIGVLIGGYTRDVYAVWTMALVGAVIGIILMVRLSVLPVFRFFCCCLILPCPGCRSESSGMSGTTITSLRRSSCRRWRWRCWTSLFWCLYGWWSTGVRRTCTRCPILASLWAVLAGWLCLSPFCTSNATWSCRQRSQAPPR